MREQESLDDMARRLETGRLTLPELTDGSHPADIARILERLREPTRVVSVFSSLDDTLASEILTHFEEETRSLILDTSPPETLGRIIGEMDSDDAADLLADVDEELAGKILAAADDDVEEEVTRLLDFDEESAGGLMQTELFSVSAESTVAEAVAELRRRADELDDVHNVFVVTDPGGVLVGTVQLRSLILNDSTRIMGELMDREPIPIHCYTDQEEVAEIFQRYDLVSAPVVNDEGILLGRITIDDIVDVMEDEASEDIIRMAGADDEALDRTHSVAEMAWFRFPWLGSSLLGGLLTGLIIWSFQGTLTEALALTAFIPVVMGMSGNVGAQSSALIIRGLATGRVHTGALRDYFIKEMKIGALLGIASGLLAGLAAQLWHASPTLGLVVAVSLFLSLLFAALVGVAIPLLFRWADIDPAIAGGPMVLALNDLTGVLIFFGVASLLLTSL